MRHGPWALLFAIVAGAFGLSLAGPTRAVTPNGRLQIVHLNVAFGDAAVIISPLGQVAMVDVGNSSLITAQLQTLGVTHVDHHFASHYHADHIGRFSTLFAAGGLTVDYGWDRAGSYGTGTYATYVSTLGSRRRTLVKGQVITLDSLSAHPVTITCVDLAGAGTGTSDENALSLVLKVSYGEYDEVFGGDRTGSSPDVESIVGPGVGPVEVYKVHHHGSATSSNTNWLNATQPQIGVISVGNNSYGHPTWDALTRLHNAGVHTYWTQQASGTPNPEWDTVANGWIYISATWESAGVDTVRGNGFADTFVNSGTAADVTPPLVAVTSPNGGENWDAGSTHSVTWAADDAGGVDSVNVDYSVEGAGGPWLPVAHGLENTGSYLWTLPAQVADGALVRVTAYDPALNQGGDTSDSLFCIVDPAADVSEPGPAALALARPQRNPSRGTTRLAFSLPRAGRARLEILDMGGRRLWHQEGFFPAGRQSCRWEGETAVGERAEAGLYFVRLVTPWGNRTERFVRLR